MLITFSQELLNNIEDFQQHSEKLLSDEVNTDSVSEIESLLEEGSQFDVCLPELPLLRERLEQARWLTGVQQAEDPVLTPCGLSLDCMRRLIDRGVGLTPHPSTERTMARLQELLTISEELEEKAQALLKARWDRATLNEDPCTNNTTIKLPFGVDTVL